ncbi:MAG: vitamin K epoxide reductase [Anaerolineae bacterium]|nr:vitamin K epoxide reductase [Anaerolineae bacterium]
MTQWLIQRFSQWLLVVFLLAGFWLLPERQVVAQSPDNVVHVVLFYSPNCGHCHYVIDEVLPPLFEQYGQHLQILAIDASQPDGYTLYQAAITQLGLESGGVPFLIIGDRYLIGSGDIPEQLPDLIEQHLAQGGLDCPAIVGLADAVNQSSPAIVILSSTTADPKEFLTKNTSKDLVARFTNDLAGNTLALIVLLVMVVSAGTGIFFLPVINIPSDRLWKWAIPALCAIGLIVAGYLAYVEVAQVEAVCGPVGDCRTVHQSSYARLFGVLPIGVLGVAGYIAILAAWVLGRYGQGKLANLAMAAMLGMAVFGLLFSIYLTFLEPFVIGATCAWCLVSAILMTLLFWLSLTPGKIALSALFPSNAK